MYMLLISSMLFLMFVLFLVLFNMVMVIFVYPVLNVIVSCMVRTMQLVPYVE